jgi:hypothetical protein
MGESIAEMSGKPKTAFSPLSFNAQKLLRFHPLGRMKTHFRGEPNGAQE